MKLYFEIWGRKIPSYGLMIVLGVILANLAALLLIRKNKQNIFDFIILEAYTFIGAFAGAKILYLLISYKEIAWEKIFEPAYFNELMQGGFVFYGGLAGGLAVALLAGKLHKINAPVYIREYIFLIPFIHSFGRLGCHLAGCCYGVPYAGIGAVEFPQGSLAPAGVSLFPVQLVESIVLMLTALIILVLQLIRKNRYGIENYFLLYGISRFMLEYFRDDKVRGYLGMWSTSQWISIALFIVVIVMLLYRHRTNRDYYSKEK